MLKSSFKLYNTLIVLLLVSSSCKQGNNDSKNAMNDKQTSTTTTDKETTNNVKNGNRLVKRITQDNQGKLVSYIKFIYNNANTLDSVNTYSNNNIQNESIAFKYNNTGNVDNLKYIDNSDDVTNVSFQYNNDIITNAQKSNSTNKTADYALTYDANKLTRIDITNNTSGSNMTNTISYNTDGKASQQTNPFFTGGIPTGSGFLIGSDEVDSIKYLEYYPQPIKSLAPPLDNLIVKQYVKKAQIGEEIFFFETTFNELGNPIKTIKKLNDANGAIQSITLYEYQ